MLQILFLHRNGIFQNVVPINRDNLFKGIRYWAMQPSQQPSTIVMQMSSYQYPTVHMHASEHVR